MANNLNIDLTNKHVIVEFRDGVYYCTGGFGCSPITGGGAIFVTNIATKEESRVEGHQIERLATDAEVKAATPEPVTIFKQMDDAISYLKDIQNDFNKSPRDSTKPRKHATSLEIAQVRNAVSEAVKDVINRDTEYSLACETLDKALETDTELNQARARETQLREKFNLSQKALRDLYRPVSKYGWDSILRVDDINPELVKTLYRQYPTIGARKIMEIAKRMLLKIADSPEAKSLEAQEEADCDAEQAHSQIVTRFYNEKRAELSGLSSDVRRDINFSPDDCERLVGIKKAIESDLEYYEEENNAEPEPKPRRVKLDAEAIATAMLAQQKNTEVN